MYIQPINSNINMYGSEKKPDFLKRIKQRFLDMLPNVTIKDSPRRLERWDKLDKFISKPAENRLIMGTTALLTQPTIDYCNKNVDKETREISRCRTLAKIIAGTSVGIMVRGLSYNLVESLTDIKSKSRFKKILLPKNNLSQLINEKKFLNNYRSALSTAIAILAMSVTNFVLDAPLTIFLTNYFNEKRLDKKEKLEQEVQEKKLEVKA